MAAKKPTLPPIAIPFETLVALLGKPVDDPAVQAVIAKAGKVKVDSEYIVAKQAGFDFALERKPGVKKKVLAYLWLFSDGRDDHAGFTGLPAPFGYLPRAELRAAIKPDGAWTMDDGDVDLDHPSSERDTWKRAGYILEAEYSRQGVAYQFTVQLPEDDTVGQDISTHPLHFEAEPADAPKQAGLVGMGLIVAWSAVRFGLPKKHAGTPAGEQLVKRAISPVTFLTTACAGTLTTADIDPRLADFFHGYTHRMFLGTRAPDRAKTAGEIKKLLKLEKADERAYTDDFLGTFKGAVKSPYYVPDSWDAVERIAPILDARWADYEATKMKTAPDLALYEKAAKLRDQVSVKPATAEVAKVAVAASLAPDLIAMIGKPLKDKAVKSTLEEAALPIGKRTDEQANPGLGVAYMGANLKVGGKPVLSVTHVDFYAAKQTSYIRGLGKEVEFRGFQGPIVLGVQMGAARADVAKAFGAPSSAREDYDYWYPDKKHRIAARYNKSDKLVFLHFALIDEDSGKAKPPFGPKGIF